MTMAGLELRKMTVAGWNGGIDGNEAEEGVEWESGDGLKDLQELGAVEKDRDIFYGEGDAVEGKLLQVILEWL